MKASTVIAVAAGFAATLVSAQLNDIPPCALNCALQSLGSTGCQETDIKCICSNSAFVTSLTPCVQGACSASDFAGTVKAAEGLCAAAGVTLSIPVGGATTSAAAASTSAAAVTTTSVAPVSTTSSASLTTSTVVVVISNSTTSVAPVSTSSGNGTVSTTGLPSPTPTGAAVRNGVAIGGLVAVLAAAAALL